MVLLLHHRYRVPGGEERVVQDSAWLWSTHLGEEVERVERDSAATRGARAAAGLLAGGLDPSEVGDAVRRTGARIVHAHNLLPTFGPRALEAARAAGARTILHLHNYRLVCAVGTCIAADGADCVRCQGRDTRPGVRLGCRGSLRESLPYAAALSAWQQRTVAAADVVVVPSRAALDRLRALDAPLPDARVHVIAHVLRPPARAPAERAPGGPALVVSRLAREKDLPTALAAAARAQVGLVVAGDGPEGPALRATAAGLGLEVLHGDPGGPVAPGQVRFTGRVDADALAALRARASVALVPSRAPETFGLAALEAMQAGLPVVAARTGALAELGDAVELADPGDVAAWAAALARAADDPSAAARGRRAAEALAGPEAVAPRWRALRTQLLG